MSLRTLVALPLLYVLPASGQARLLASATLLATPTAHRAASHSPAHWLLQSIVASATPGAISVGLASRLEYTLSSELPLPYCVSQVQPPICKLGCEGDACGCGELRPESKVAGCPPRWVPGDVSHMHDTASMVPAIVTLNGVQIGHPVEAGPDGQGKEHGTDGSTSCDEIAAIGVRDGVVRGVSSLIVSGFSIGMIGDHGEQIEFRYWNSKQGKEYFIDYQYTMASNEQVGSFGKGKEINLVLSDTYACKPCANRCSHYLFEPPGSKVYPFVLQLGASEECVENPAKGTCELSSGVARTNGARTCLAGPLVTSPECYTPCSQLHGKLHAELRRQLGTTRGTADAGSAPPAAASLLGTWGSGYFFAAAALLLCIACGLRGRSSSGRGAYKRLDHLG